jgi:hypothetical protein
VHGDQSVVWLGAADRDVHGESLQRTRVLLQRLRDLKRKRNMPTARNEDRRD